MKERPILFNAPMVRALLSGQKTQTRRAVKPQFAVDAVPAEMGATNERGHQISGHSGEWWCDAEGNPEKSVRCPYGQPGDRLWVRETWAQPDKRADNRGLWVYAADWPDAERPTHRWRPSIHMPRAASRILLEVIAVRVERLQDISEADAVAEGVDFAGHTDEIMHDYSPDERFSMLWESINGAGSWNENPWVWVVEFRRVEA